MAIPTSTLTALLERKEEEMRNLSQMRGNRGIYSKIGRDQGGQKPNCKSWLSDEDSPCNEIEFARNTVDKLRYYTNEYTLELEKKILLLLAQVNAGGTEIENLKFQQRKLNQELANRQMLVDELKICLNSCSKELKTCQEKQYTAKQGLCEKDLHRYYDNQLKNQVTTLQLSYLKNRQVTHAEEIRDLNHLIDKYKTTNEHLHEQLERFKAEAQEKANELILTKSNKFKAEELAKDLKAQLKYSSSHKEDETKATSKCKTPVSKVPSLTEDNSLPEQSNKKNCRRLCTLEERNRIKDSEISRLKMLIAHIKMERDKNYEEKELFKEINRELFSHSLGLDIEDINKPSSRGQSIPRPRNALKIELQRHRSNPRDYTTIV